MIDTTEWTKASAETLAKADMIFGMLQSITDGPQEGAEILTRVLVMHWLYGRGPNSDLGRMLEGLCTCIRHNVERAEANLQ